MKRALLYGLSVVTILALLAACGPAPTPEVVEKVVKETVVVEKEVEVTKEVVKEVEKIVEVGALQGPVAYLEGPLMPGSRAPRTFNLDQIFTYKKLDSYSQAPWLDALVADGTLPPVEERLPENPQVILTSFMSDGIGEYGGVWRDVWAAPTEGWNWAAGQSAGWFGINAISQEELVQTGEIWMRGDKIEPLPNLATSWEWSEDGYELTMHLIEGAKWSDGDPFTSEDVMFTWEDMILDDNVNSVTTRSTWQIEGKDISLEALDDYTIKWTFPVPFPAYKLFDMDFWDFAIAPSHILKPLHPKYDPSMDYVTFENALPPDSVPVVTMGPWVAVYYKTDEIMVFRRNPYYWKVDENGRQLPYIDEVYYEKADTGVVRTLKTLAGSADHANVENPETYVEVSQQAMAPGAPFTIEWGPETLGFSLYINQSADYGVTDERGAEVRKLFRDLRFRRALTQAIDRDGIARSISEGPFFRAWPGGIFPGSQFYDINSVVYYPYAPETSKALLAEMGFEDTDNNGFLNWTSGPLAGQDMVIGLSAIEDQAGGPTIAEALVTLFADVGIQVNYRPQLESVRGEQEVSGEWDMFVDRLSQEWDTPNTRCRDLAPVAKEYPEWHREGTEPRQLQPFEEELIDIVNEFCPEPDSARQKELMSQYNKIHTENVYTIGVVIGRYGLAMSKRFRNIPVGAPAFMYQWDFNNYMPEQIWIPQEIQADVPQTMPNTIPIYE